MVFLFSIYLWGQILSFGSCPSLALVLLEEEKRRPGFGKDYPLLAVLRSKFASNFRNLSCCIIKVSVQFLSVQFLEDLERSEKRNFKEIHSRMFELQPICNRPHRCIEISLVNSGGFQVWAHLRKEQFLIRIVTKNDKL